MKVNVVVTENLRSTASSKALKLTKNYHLSKSKKNQNKYSNSNTNLHINTTPKRELPNFSRTTKNHSTKSNKAQKTKHIYINTKEKSPKNEDNSLDEYISKKKTKPKLLDKINLHKKKSPSFICKKRIEMSHTIEDNNTINNVKNIFEMKLKNTPIKLKNLARKRIFNKTATINNKITSIYSREIEKNNKKLTISNLQKEIESLNRENLYKGMLINNMKQQIEEYQKDKEFTDKNNKLLKEINSMKEKKNHKENNRNNENKNLTNANQLEILEKLKKNITKHQNLITELQNENKQLKIDLDKKLHPNNHINKNKKSEDISKRNENIINNIEQKEEDSFSEYVKMKCISNIKKNKNNYGDLKLLTDKQKNEIHFMIQMILLSNGIAEDKVMNLLLENLTNLNKIIEKLINDYLKLNSILDKQTIHNYFISLICINDDISKVDKEEDLKFNIISLFIEFHSYFSNINLQNFFASKKVNSIIDKNENIKQLITECKYQDQFNTGTIELKQFNEIFINAYGNLNEINNHNLYVILIYIMKIYKKIENLDLFYLCYKNLNIDEYSQINSNIPTIKSACNYNNDNLGKKPDDTKQYFAQNYSENNVNESSESKGKSAKSSEEITANVEIDVLKSTAYVNLKLIKDDKENNLKNSEDMSESEKISEENGNRYDFASRIAKSFVDDIFKNCGADVKRRSVIIGRSNLKSIVGHS